MRNTSGLRPWKPGQSGNPNGRPKTKPATDELKAQLDAARDVGDGTDLRAIISEVKRRAANGEQWAVQLVFDRLDGKVPQPIAGDDDLDPVTVRTIVTGVPRASDD